MIAPQNTSSARSPWLAPLQWLTGVLLFISLSACLLFYNLSGITERPVATSIMTTVITKVFDQSGIASQVNLDQLKQVAAAVPDGTELSLPQLPTIHLSKQDILSLSSPDIMADIFGQITGNIYDKGLAGAMATLTTDPDVQKNVSTQGAPLNIFTKSTHELARQLFTLSLAISAVLAVLLVLLSTGWGRLANLGAVLLLVSPVGALVALLLTRTSLGSRLSSLATPTIIQTVIDNLTHSYLYAAVAGIGLLVLAALGKLITSFVSRSKATPAVPESTN